MRIVERAIVATVIETYCEHCGKPIVFPVFYDRKSVDVEELRRLVPVCDDCVPCGTMSVWFDPRHIDIVKNGTQFSH